MLKRRRLLLFLLLLVAVFWLLRERLAGPTVADGSFLLVPIDGEYVEEPPADLLGRLFGRTKRTVVDVVRALQVAGADDRVRGILLRVGTPEIGWAKAEEIRAALARFREAGKRVYAVLENEAAVANKSYFLASVADRVYLAPVTTAPLVGLSAQYLFLGGVWEKVDVDMNVEKIGAYKTAGDMLVNREMSPAHREMANSLLDSIDQRFLSAIATARGMTLERMRQLIDQAPTRGEEFQQSGLADGVKYLEDVQDEDANAAPLVELDDYMDVDPTSVGLHAKHTIAVVYGSGPIVAGEGGDRVAGGSVMGADTVIEAFDDAADDDDVKAILFRVDSPGGSALASDLIWQATQRAKEKKPVIVSMSDVAGSGGYYVASGANRIIVQPTTLTGSIGVVFSKPNIDRLLGRLGITTETLTRGKYASINDLTAPFDDDTRKKIVGEIEHIYDRFVDRVARGRGLSKERVDALGQGRVWTGAQAVANGLADATGGFPEAIEAAREAAGLPAGEYVELTFYPRRKTFAERLTELLRSRVGVQQVPIPGWDRLRRAMARYPFTEPGVFAVMPELITID